MRRATIYPNPCHECGAKPTLHRCCGHLGEFDSDGLPVTLRVWCFRHLCGDCAIRVSRIDGTTGVAYCKECAAGDGERTASEGSRAAKQAAISPCGMYRWTLRRLWDDSRRRVVWIGLNPSTADASADDPTLVRMQDFARRWGFGSLAVVNLFAFRSTDPAGLARADDPVGSEADAWIDRELSGDSEIIACWGSASKLRGDLRERFCDRARHVLSRLPRPASALAINRDGTPKHPLYISKFAALSPYAVQREFAETLPELEGK